LPERTAIEPTRTSGVRVAAGEGGHGAGGREFLKLLGILPKLPKHGETRSGSTGRIAHIIIYRIALSSRRNRLLHFLCTTRRPQRSPFRFENMEGQKIAVKSRRKVADRLPFILE
jgi:hypothetical protein